MDTAIIIAGYAAIISTIGAAWQLRQWTASRLAMKTEAGFAYGGGPPPKEMIAVSIANTGPNAVTVHEAGLKFPDGATLPYLSGAMGVPGTMFPKRIEAFDQI